MANKQSKYLEENKLFPGAQYGNKAYSCLTNLLLTLDDWTQAVDVGETILDMSKAFDRVNHSILLQKLERCSITGRLLAWLQIESS